MKLSLTIEQLIDYSDKQLGLFYPDGCVVSQQLKQVMPQVIERLDYCFSHIRKKYYFEAGEAMFNHLHSDHYAMYLYLLANEAYRQNALVLAEKAFLLNKALHGIDAFYAVTLPDIFLFVHPVGTVLGNASYQDYLVVYQNVTVGSDVAGIYPQFGKGNVLYSKCSVIGDCRLGDNISFANNSSLRNVHVDNNSLVFGMTPHNSIKNNQRNNLQDFFG